MRNLAKRRSALAAIAMMLVALAVAGCGVPWSSGVITDRSANNPGIGPGGPLSNLPSGPDFIKDPDAFVEQYLSALAGHSDSDQANLRSTAEAFMSRDVQDTWQAGHLITVIRPIGTAEVSSYATAGSEYTNTYTVLGVFSPTDGTLTPPATRSTIKLTFHMTPVLNDQGTQIQRLQFVGKVPSGLYLSEDALTKYYRAQDIYFWDTNKEMLISELRYAPLTVTTLQRDTMITNWVLAGPSDALGAAAKPVVNATLLDPLVTEVDDRVVVDLAPTHSMSPADGLKLADQLRWSLSGDGSGGMRVIQLQVDRQDQLPPDRSAVDANNPISGNNEPRSFAIGNGVVHPLTDPPVPILSSNYNTDVESAAVSSDLRSVALVRHLDGQDQLWVRADPASDFKKLAVGSSISRPNMIANPHRLVAVVIDGQLRLIDGAKKQVKTVSVPGLTNVKTISIAPDDRRFAIVSGGRLYTSNLIWQSDSPSMTPARPVWPNAAKVNLVDWSGQSRLVIASPQGKEDALYEINSDGGNAHEIGTSAAPISTLAAYPYNPIDKAVLSAIMYQSPAEARQAHTTQALGWSATNSGAWGALKSPFFSD